MHSQLLGKELHRNTGEKSSNTVIPITLNEDIDCKILSFVFKPFKFKNNLL